MRRIDQIVEQMRSELERDEEGIRKREIERMAREIKRQLNIYRNFNPNRGHQPRSYSNPRPST